jgi:hypothetical protein
MKKIIILYIGLCFMLTCNCFAGNVYTADQLEKFVTKACKIEKNKVITTDRIYQEYSLLRALHFADSTNFRPRSNLFDCDDIAQAVRSIIICHVAEVNDSGGAVMVGIAYVKLSEESYHMLNILIEKKKVYLYDWQEATRENMLTSPQDYLKKGVKFILIEF